MKNCKNPNNGGNVLIKRDNNIVLMDQSLNEISSIPLPEIPEPPDISGKLDKSEAKEEYAHDLILDGSTLKLMNHEATPVALASVALPTPGGGSIHAHAMALYNNSTESAAVAAEYAAEGIRIKAHNTDDSAKLSFDIELVDPTKYVFNTSKPIYWRYLAYNSGYYVYVPMTASEAVYIPGLVTPADSTSDISCSKSMDWQTYDTSTAIIEVWAELEPV